jgi:hypothetical protein
MPYTVDEIDVFFDDELTVTAYYDLKPFTVIFDNNFVIAVDGVETSTPAATCKTADVTELGIKRTDEININDTVYRVTMLRHDGAGITTLILENINV